jgi:hypothetical protein
MDKLLCLIETLDGYENSDLAESALQNLLMLAQENPQAIAQLAKAFNL